MTNVAEVLEVLPTSIDIMGLAGSTVKTAEKALPYLAYAANIWSDPFLFYKRGPFKVIYGTPDPITLQLIEN